MPRDADQSLQLGFLIRFVEPDLKPEEIETEVQYLQEDLLDLSGMGQTRFQFLTSRRNQLQFRDGVRFEAPPDRLRVIMRRLCDRLNDTPQETLVLIYYGQVRLQIQTRQAEELASIYAPAEALLPPDSIYLAKAETYVRTRGELSPAEEANLDLLAHQLGLDPAEAETLKSIAMGPFKSLQEKRQRFLEIMTDELAHDYPPSPETKSVLYELAENLRLPQSEADTLYQAYLQKLQAEVEVRLKQEQAAAEATRKQAAERDQRQQEQQSLLDQQQKLEQYRELFRRAIQKSLYPLAFDQGRLEQTRQLWQISPDTARELEEEVRSELYGSIQSATGTDYTRLRQLLWSQAWRDADQETENVILKTLSQDMEPINREQAMRLPCVDLLTIDQLWSRHSGGKFGFQAQYRIFEEVQRNPHDFQRQLEWRSDAFNLGENLKPYKALSFTLKAPDGHLPSWRWSCPSLEGGYNVSDAVIEGFFLHMAKCLSTDMPLPAPSTWEPPGET